MPIRRPPDIPTSDITPERIFLDRRSFIRQAALGTAAAAFAPSTLSGAPSRPGQDPKFSELESELGEPVNEWNEITTYNNFYEFGTEK